MAATKYSLMKEHFDKLILGKFPRSTGLEPIRDTYSIALNTSINLQDVYETRLGISTNPIKGIITLVGPYPEDNIDLPSGLVGFNENDVYYVNHLSEEIFTGIDDNLAKYYINEIFCTMYGIMDFDKFKISEIKARYNPYAELLYAYPFYFTFHHIKESVPYIFKEEYFIDLLNKYYNGDYADDIIESISTNRYTNDAEQIYSIMNCKNTIDSFL